MLGATMSHKRGGLVGALGGGQNSMKGLYSYLENANMGIGGLGVVNRVFVGHG